MLSRLKALIKGNKRLYQLYYLVGSAVLRIVGVFVKTDPNLILFISYGGQKFDDSPRVVYDYLCSHPVNASHRYYWAFISPESFPQVENKVKVDTPAYYLLALRAGTWITNSSASRGLNFKKNSTKNVLFPHGMTGIKKIGADIEQADKAYSLGFHEKFDYIFLEGKKEQAILERAWRMPSEVFYTTGLPRNDDLKECIPEEIKKIHSRLGLPEGKKVILYAPTFREFSRNGDGYNTLGIPMNFAKWEKTLGEEYVLVITAHYEVAKLLDEIPENQFVFNAFKYPELNDLLKITDVLISDYSSIVFDYSILERPILCYGYDYESYVKERGVYTDLEKLFSHGVIKTEDELLRALQDLNFEAESRYTKEHIKEEYIADYGDAARKAVSIILNC